jgi:hypothetical protein
LTIPAKNAKSLDLSTSLVQGFRRAGSSSIGRIGGCTLSKDPNFKKGYPDQKRRRKDAEIFFPRHFLCFNIPKSLDFSNFLLLVQFVGLVVLIHKIGPVGGKGGLGIECKRGTKCVSFGCKGGSFR